MKIVNDPSNNSTNEEVAYSNTSMVKEVTIEENGMCLVAKGKELEEEANCCFVLGYN
tara:strand:+ start:60311 stop:60481 length:171 start_codon:yes stop_codon:yes gene_type:complete